jgi:hypothetical protein
MSFNRLAFGSIMLVLLIGRLAISGAGYLEDPDEMPYAMIHVQSGQSSFSEPGPWVRLMTQMETPPSEAALRLAQYRLAVKYSDLIGKPVLHTDALLVPGLFNVLISLAQLLVFFLILRRLSCSFTLSLTGMLLLGTLFNMNVYTRHILPYDHSLLLHLLTMCLLLSPRLLTRHVLLAGILTAIALTGYPGYFMFVAINGMLLLLSVRKKNVSLFSSAACFGAPLVMLVGFYEFITYTEGLSYAGAMHDYSQTIVNGSFEEGLVYAFIYFHRVEGLWGIVLLTVALSGILVTLVRRPDEGRLHTVLGLGLAAYLVFGSMVFFLHMFVFYGRVLHMYYPFVILGVLALGCRIKPSWQLPACIVLSLAALVNYGAVIMDLNSIGYPRTLINSHGICGNEGNAEIAHVYEMDPGLDYGQRPKYRIDSVCDPVVPSGRYNLVNGGFLKDYPDDYLESYAPFVPPGSDSLLLDRPHFQSHPAYTFEYCTRQGREFFLRHGFRIRLYRHGE